MAKIGKAQWVCKTCKGKFETMADAKYHKCVPVKFQRPPRQAQGQGRLIRGDVSSPIVNGYQQQPNAEQK